MNPKQTKKPRKRLPVLNYMTASEKHLEFHNTYDGAPVRILCGGYGSGKTHAVAAEILMQLLDNKNFIGQTALVVGLTASHNRNLLLPEFKKILSWKNKKGVDMGYVEGRDYIISATPDLALTFGNGSKVIFKSLEAGQNLAGFNVAIVWADEIDKISLDTWNEVQNRCRSVDNGVVYGTCNPGNQSHWLYEHYFKYLDENGVSKEGTYCLYLTMYDNKFLPKQYLEMQERKYGYSGLERERAINGRFVSMEGLVYEMWDRKRHVRERDKFPIGQDWPVFAGIDFGFKDPTAYLRIAITPDEKFVIFFEHYKEQWTPKQHAEIIRRKISHTQLPAKTYSDHYSETVQTYKELGVQLTLADKGKGSVMNGVKLIQQLLLEDRLVVLDNCINTIREFESYAWKKESKTSGTDEPIDKFNHSLDCARYILFEIATRGIFEAFSFHDYKPQTQIQLIQSPQFVGYDFKGEPVWA